jgi:hypothetical protein
VEAIEEEYRYCAECFSNVGIESHHITYRKKCKPLENCKHNLVDLCYIHHRDHKEGIHHNHELNQKYKLKFQNYLEMSFLKEYLTREEIKEVLEISEHPLDKLLSSLITHNSKYNREELILICLGGKKVEVTNE